MRTPIVAALAVLAATTAAAQVRQIAPPTRVMALDAEAALKARGRAAYRAGKSPEALAAEIRAAYPKRGDEAVSVALQAAVDTGHEESARLKAGVPPCLGEGRCKSDDRGATGDAEQLRLQVVMDRTSKFESTLSNLMKKTSETQSAIVNNMK